MSVTLSVTRRHFIRSSGAAAGVALATDVLGARPAAARSRQQPAALTWMLAGGGFANLSNRALGGNPTVCRNAFDNDRTWFITTYSGDSTVPTPVPSGYSGVAVLKFKCYQDGSTGLVDALAAGLPSWVTAVQYDAESWSQTPDVEQGAWIVNPHTQISYAQRFCATAHSHGLRVILSPGNDLCNNSPNPAYPQRKPQYPVTSKDAGQNYNAFVRHGLASAAQYLAAGDIFEYQAQELELDAGTYAAITAKVAGQVKAANPAAVVLAGLGRSKPPSDGATCAQLTAAATGVATDTAGFWLNVGAYTSQVRPMICALKQMGF